MLPFRLVYHDGYDLNFGAHVFPTQKYRLIRRYLLDRFLAGPEDFVTPEAIGREDLLRIHTEEWIRKLETGTISYHEIIRLEVPYSQQMVRAYLLAAGGTLLAGLLALEHRAAINLGGGFHHAFPDYGEGFCAIHDVAVAIRSLQAGGTIRRALVVDCDVHHGNGTAAIFTGDATVYTISIHQFANYPAEKPPSTVDIHLADGTSDEEYLARLEPACRRAFEEFQPDILFYVAGSDPYLDDQLGGLSLTKDGMYRRDRLVFDLAVDAGVAVAAVLAGGYARVLEDTVELHVSTVLAARDALDR